MIGQIFGRWKVLEDLGSTKDRKHYWLCECQCKDKTIRKVRQDGLKSGASTSCGCVNKESSKHIVHGLTKHPLYKIWGGIVQRCTNPNSSRYSEWGGRGIFMCDEWRLHPELFIEWALEEGWKPKSKLTIDRYPDPLGRYSPENCRVATYAEQNRNLSTNIKVEINGENLCLKDARDKYGKVKYGTAISRIRKGWEPLEAILTPLMERKKIRKKNNHMATIKGETLPLKEAVEKYSPVSYNTVFWRIQNGWSIEDAILTPSLPRGNNVINRRKNEE